EGYGILSGRSASRSQRRGCGRGHGRILRARRRRGRRALGGGKRRSTQHRDVACARGLQSTLDCPAIHRGSLVGSGDLRSDVTPGPVPCHVLLADDTYKILAGERADKARITARLGEYVQAWRRHLIILAGWLLRRR